MAGREGVRYIVGVNLRPVIATSIGIALFRGIVSPMMTRYLQWRNSSRVLVARRNWRGVYVPDLHVKRGERIFWMAWLAIVAVGAAVGWKIMVKH